MTAATLDRTADQRAAALVVANGIRQRRAVVKRLLKRGELTATAVLLDPEPAVARMKVRDLLRSLPAWGPKKASWTMRRCRIADAKTVVGVTGRQRDELLHRLDGR